MDRSAQAPTRVGRRILLAASICLFGQLTQAQEPVIKERGEKPWSEKVGPTIPLPPMPPFAELLPELKRGGFVIFVRHPKTDTKDVSSDPVNHERCEGQRNLSAEGEAQAKTLGKAFRNLGVPVGDVIVSPSCRTRDTARLAFDRYTVDKDLDYSLRVNEEASMRLANSLRTLISAKPAAGKNTVLIGHSGNLREAIGIFPKPEGVTFIFRPNGKGGYDIVGKMTIEDLAKAAGLAAASDKP